VEGNTAQPTGHPCPKPRKPKKSSDFLQKAQFLLHISNFSLDFLAFVWKRKPKKSSRFSQKSLFLHNFSTFSLDFFVFLTFVMDILL